MSYFITANDLNSELENILEMAETELILISPYIKLHERYKSVLKTKLNNPELTIVVVFGKNESDVSKSMSHNDFEFFKQFPNIQIKHEKRLHAKLYANENDVLITSMNLYDYSQDTNIETGILTKANDRKIGASSLSYFERVIDQAVLLFDKVPVYEKGMLGLTKKYRNSEIEYDVSTEFYNNSKFIETRKAKRERENKYEHVNLQNKNGFCIRTGVEIPFNIEKPLSNSAYKSWKKFENPDYAEKYCHFTGEFSSGETSVKRPILNKNWKEAKRVHGL
jgi:hypothetical protein